MERIEQIKNRIRLLKLTTLRLMQGALQGETKTAAFGNGFLFDQTRDYQVGDDIRFIDWNAYARTNQLSVKQYKEERKKNVFVLVDLSASSKMDTAQCSKRDIGIDIASLVMLASVYNGDSVDIVGYSDQIEFSRALSNRSASVLNAIEQLMLLEPHAQGTSIDEAIEYLNTRYGKKRGIVLFVSDCIDDSLETGIKRLRKYHDARAIRCLDPIEQNLQFSGLLRVADMETGAYGCVQLNASRVQTVLAERYETQKRWFTRYGIPLLDISTDEADIPMKVIRFLSSGRKR